MKSTVVVVDDVLESQESTSALLKAEGYTVSAVLNGEEALTTIAKQKPAAVLFGILEPAKGAIDFVRRLALTGHATTLPVVIVTALNEFQLGSFLNGVPGIRKIVYAPASPEVLLGAIAQSVQYQKR